MQSTIKPSLIALILLPGQVLAAGFQLAEQSATGMGRAFAGEAAIADNASVLARNAAALAVAHNHPSGEAEPSRADELLTQNLKHALSLVDVRVIDHFVVAGDTVVSFAERGLV